MKRWFVIIGGTILALFVVAGVLVPVLTRPRPLAPFNQPEALRQATAKLDQARDQLKQGRAVVTLSQSEVRAVLAAGTAQAAGGSLQGVDISLTPGRLQVQANLTTRGRTVSLTIAGAPSLSDNALVLGVDRVEVGSLPVPVGAVMQLLASQGGGIQVNAEARALTIPLSSLQVGGQPVALENLTVGQGELTLNLSSR